MIKSLMIGVMMFLAILETVSAQYQGWQHFGSLYLLTTPEGANLPATASEENFPLLVRLNKDSFNFNQAKAGGDDIRFSAEGKPLAYQIEDWDAVAGTASIWVRIPNIKGNARQEIKIYWGNRWTGLPCTSRSIAFSCSTVSRYTVILFAGMDAWDAILRRYPHVFGKFDL